MSARTRLLPVVSLLAATAPAAVAAQPTAAARFASAGVGLARVGERNGIAGTLGVSFRRGPLVATLSPIDILILPKWDDDYQASGDRCRNAATGSFVEQSLCDARAEYGASAEAGVLLGAGATRVWLGGGWLAGTADAAYAGLTTHLRWGETPHLQLRFRAGDRYVQGSIGFGSPF